MSRLVIHKGGPGSGNFGHAGRPGEVGGSGEGGGGPLPTDPSTMTAAELRNYARANLGGPLGKIKDVEMLRALIQQHHDMAIKMGLPVAAATVASSQRREAAKERLKADATELFVSAEQIDTHRVLDQAYVDAYNLSLKHGLGSEALLNKAIEVRKEGHRLCVKQNGRLMRASGMAVREAVKLRNMVPAKTKAENWLKLQPFGVNISTDIGDIWTPNSQKKIPALSGSLPVPVLPWDGQLAHGIQLPSLESCFDELWDVAEEGDAEALSALLDQSAQVLARTTKGGPGSGNHGHAGRAGEVGGSGMGAVAGARSKPPALSEKARRAKAAHVMVDKEIQRYCEEHNEAAFAKAVGGVSFPNSEPIDIAIPGPSGMVQHGVELKTMVKNTNGKLTMKKDAQDRKAAWERKNRARIHTVVVDDHKVFNARGPGKHDESKRVYYYRRGYGSFRISSMHRVEGGIKEIKKLLNTPTRSLPENAKP